VSDARPITGDLAGVWWAYQRLAQGSRENRKRLSLGEPAEICAGWEGAGDRINAGGIDALELVVALVDAAPDRAGLALVGTGPLEDLVHEHGVALVTEIEGLARQHAGFSQALRSVWLSAGALDPEVARRLTPWISI
jgi:hypothetical protein